MKLSRPFQFFLGLVAPLSLAAALADDAAVFVVPNVYGSSQAGYAHLLGSPDDLALMAAFVISLAVSLWVIGRHVAAQPIIGAPLGRLDAGLRFVLSLGFTLAALAVPVAFGLDYGGAQVDGQSRGVLRTLAHQAQPAWPALDALLSKGLPARIPPGEGWTRLEALGRYPYVQSAFDLAPDGHLRLCVAGGPDRPALRFEADMATWQPRLLNPFRRAGKARARTRLDRQAWLREFELKQVRVRLEEIIGEDRASFLPLRIARVGDRVMVVCGHHRRGYVGYWLSEPTFARDARQLLDRYGLDDALDLEFGPTEGDERLLAAPSGLSPVLAQASMVPSMFGFSQYADRQTGPQWALALLCAAFGLAGAALTLGQARAFLDQRALALAQSDFVSAVSHEMRTPLTTIKMYAEMVEQGVVESAEKRGAYMRTIAKECDRLSRLVENVLDYARIGRGQRTYRLADTAIAPLVAEALAALEGPLRQAALAVEVDVPDALHARVDRDAIVQGLINLLGNAAKYAPDGGRVRVSARREGQSLVLGVQDFGPGIASVEQRKIFQPFYRIGSELTRTASGTGLGLALVDAHAKGHGGWVELVSAPGQGATFRLVLPQERTIA